jgi:Protein of unknown function (DUF2934)
MKNNQLLQSKKEIVPGGSNSAGTNGIDQTETDFVPAPDEVARKAYFSYVNQGSSSGHEVQHWLAAEAELITERNLTRVHGFHNKT